MVVFMDRETEEKIRDVVARAADGGLPEKTAVEEIIRIVENYADRAVIAYLELERRHREN
jgi:predicted transcriptional regulator